MAENAVGTSEPVTTSQPIKAKLPFGKTTKNLHLLKAAAFRIIQDSSSEVRRGRHVVSARLAIAATSNMSFYA